MSILSKRENLLLNNQFLVSFGVVLYSFARVSNLSDSFEIEAVSEGGLNSHPEILMKPKTKAETLILEKGVLKSVLGLQDSMLRTGIPVMAVTIMVMNRGMVRKAYFLEEGIITKWELTNLDAMGKDVLVKKVEITHSGLIEVPVP